MPLPMSSEFCISWLIRASDIWELFIFPMLSEIDIALALAHKYTICRQIYWNPTHSNDRIAHLSRPWSIGWVDLSFLVCRSFVCPAMVTSDQISTFFNILRHKSLVLTQLHLLPDMEFVQNFTPPDFRAKHFTPSVSPNFNSFSKKKHKKMSENGEIYTAGKNFTLPPAVTGWTNSTSAYY